MAVLTDQLESLKKDLKKSPKKKTTKKKSKQLPEGTVKIRKSGAKYKKIDGKWVYQGREKMEGEPRYKVDRVHKSKPDGTITTRADGTKWKKENGKWVYQKKKDYIKYGV